MLIDNRKIDEMGIWFLDVVLINDFENVEECLIYLELLKFFNMVFIWKNKMKNFILKNICLWVMLFWKLKVVDIFSFLMKWWNKMIF